MKTEMKVICIKTITSIHTNHCFIPLKLYTLNIDETNKSMATLWDYRGHHKLSGPFKRKRIRLPPQELANTIPSRFYSFSNLS